MAFYDNKQWLLSHIRHSFISSDDTGMCEMVMLGEDISRKISTVTKFDHYPGMEESEEDDDELDLFGQSLDIQSDLEYNLRRPYSGSSARVSKMEQDRKKAAKVKHIKWEGGQTAMSDEERAGLFERKNFKKNKENALVRKHSLLTEQLENCPNLPQNPFAEYAKFDGHVGVPTKVCSIFLTMLGPERRNYPIEVPVVAVAKIQEFIGLICWKLSLEIGPQNLKDGVDHYALYIAEDDGEVDWDFPCLDPRETVAKFGFNYLALVERPKDAKQELREEVEVIIVPDSWKPRQTRPDAVHDANIQSIFDGLLAPLPGSYHVNILSKLKYKTEVVLGISGDKIHIDPVVQQKVSSKFLSRQKAASYDIDCIAACDLTDTKSNGRSTFRLVYCNKTSASSDQGESSQNQSDLTNYKHHDFETDQRKAEEIVQKINHILQLKCSLKRKEYLELREKKSHRKRSFPLGPR